MRKSRYDNRLVGVETADGFRERLIKFVQWIMFKN